MQVSAPPLLPIFRSPTQGLLLAIVLASDRTFTLRELANAVDADEATVSREVSRLVDAGVLLDERLGRNRLVRANPLSPFSPELGVLATKAFGPAHLAHDIFGPMPGVHRVVIFGSWAARQRGLPGPAPRDLDVLLVGSPRRVAAHSGAADLERRIGLPVQVTFASPKEWDEASVLLIRQVKSGPHIEFEPS